MKAFPKACEELLCFHFYQDMADRQHVKLRNPTFIYHTDRTESYVKKEV